MKLAVTKDACYFPYLQIAKTFAMSRFSTLLFAVGFGLFAPFFSFISCGDNSDTPEKITTDPDEAKPGTYKVVISIVGDVADYSPMISMFGLHKPSSCTPLVGHIADSTYNAAPDKKTRLYSTYNLVLSYHKYPSLFSSPISIVTIPQAHGLSVTMASLGEYQGKFGAKVKYNIKGYFNDRLLQDTIISHATHDFPVTYLLGNMSGDINKVYQDAQK